MEKLEGVRPGVESSRTRCRSSGALFTKECQSQDIAFFAAAAAPSPEVIHSDEGFGRVRSLSGAYEKRAPSVGTHKTRN